MITIANLKTMLAEKMNKGDNDIAVHADALKQIQAMRDKLQDISGYDETKLAEADLTIMHDVLVFFKPEFMFHGTTMEDWQLMPAAQEDFEEGLQEMEDKRGLVSSNILFPAVLVADYILEHKAFSV